MLPPLQSHSSDESRREFAVEVVRRLQEAGYRALWAGGCVRDTVFGTRTPQDYDVATSARPEQVRDVFGHRRTRAVGVSFGVVLVRGPKEAGDVEVATFRTEGAYKDGRRPESVAYSTAEEDAQRRDFTINGMFLDPISGEVFDFVGGQSDFNARILRAIGDPHDRMREDKLRMLRAVRFAAVMDFALDPMTADAIREMAPEIHIVSAERISQEFRKMLIDRNRRRAVELAVDVHLLPLVFPELGSLVAADRHESASVTWDRTLAMLQSFNQPSFELAAAALLHGAIDADAPDRVAVAKDFAGQIGRRLKFSNLEIDRIGWLLGHQYDLVDAPNLRQSQLKRLFAEPFSRELLSLIRAELLATGGDQASLKFCEEFLESHSEAEIDPPPLITGQELIAAGLKPGSRFRELLEQVRDAQLNGEITTKDEALILLRRLISDNR